MRRRIVTITVVAALCVGWYFFIALGHNATTMRHGGQGQICYRELPPGTIHTPESSLWSKHHLVPVGVECRYTMPDGSMTSIFVASAWGAVAAAPLVLTAVGAGGWAAWRAVSPALARRREQGPARQT